MEMIIKGLYEKTKNIIHMNMYEVVKKNGKKSLYKGTLKGCNEYILKNKQTQDLDKKEHKKRRE